MSYTDRLRTRPGMAGKIKEKVGEATDNEQLQAEGQLDQSKSQRQADGEHLKDAAKDVKDTFPQ